jgi:hypothetical protein
MVKLEMRVAGYEDFGVDMPLAISPRLRKRPESGDFA